VLPTRVGDCSIDHRGIGNLSGAIRRWETGGVVGHIGASRV
jgi:hypothetical protein